MASTCGFGVTRSCIALRSGGRAVGRGRRRGKARGIGQWLRALDPVRVSIYAQIVIGISAIQMFIGSLNSLRPALMFMALGVFGIMRKPNDVAWRALRLSWVPKAVLALFLLACGSVFFGISAGGSANYITSFYWKTVLFSLMILIGVRNARDLALFMWAFTISVGILVFLAIFVMDVNVTNTGLGRVQGAGMFDANDLGLVFLMGLPLAFLFSFNAQGVGRWIARALVVGVPVGVALTGSRGAMVGFVVLGPVLFFTLSRIGIGKRVGAVALVAISLAVAAPEGYWEQMRTILDPDEDYNVTEDYGRVALAKRGVGYMLSYPIFGVGIGNFSRAEGTISSLAVEALSSGQSAQWWAPHNTYVQVGAELGAIALLIWLSLLYAGTVGLWRLHARIPVRWEAESSERRFLREACLFLPGSFLTFGVTSFFLSHAYTPPLYIFVAFLGSLHVLVGRELRRDALVRAGGTPSHSKTALGQLAGLPKH